MMSAGRNPKRDAGEPARQLLAQRADVVGGRTMILGELDLDVAVLRADDAGVVVGQIDAADRHADVVDQRRQLRGGNDRRGSRSRSLRTAWRSPRRACRREARTCMRIWPVSTEGKKFRPRKGVSRNDAPTKAGSRRRRRHGAPSPTRERRDSRSRIRSKPASKPCWNRTSGLREALRRAVLPDGTDAASADNCAIVGTSVRDRMKELTIAKMTASAIGTKR